VGGYLPRVKADTRRRRDRRPPWRRRGRRSTAPSGGRY